jgi:hypothetical protein
MLHQSKRVGVFCALLAAGAMAAMAGSPSLAAPVGYNSRPLIVNAGPARQFDSQVPCKLQFSYTLGPNQTVLFFTFGWNPVDTEDWTVMNDTVNASNPAVSLTNVATQLTSSTTVTYWLTVQNLTSSNQNIEGRYCILHR